MITWISIRERSSIFQGLICKPWKKELLFPEKQSSGFAGVHLAYPMLRGSLQSEVGKAREQEGGDNEKVFVLTFELLRSTVPTDSKFYFDFPAM